MTAALHSDPNGENSAGAKPASANFVITASNTVGMITLRRDTAAGALKKTIELLASGYRDVYVTDEQGQQIPAIEFAKRFGDA